jgi:hypothetical protein
MNKNTMFPKRVQSDPNHRAGSPNRSQDYGMAADAFACKGKRKAKGPDPQQTTKTLHTNKPTSFEVGYAKPPKERQFSPGQSGNPFGRPLGAKNKPKPDQDALSLREIILAQANREIPIQEGGKTKKIPAKEVIIRATFAAAAKGDARAQKTVLYLMQSAEASKENERRTLYEAAVDYKLAWERKVDAYHANGLDKLGHEPERPMPDPDHIHIDHVTGTIEIRGPLSRDDIPKFEWLAEQRATCIERVKSISARLCQCFEDKELKVLKRQLAKAEDHLYKINFLIGDWFQK